MNRGPLHIAIGRVDEHDDTDFDCIDSDAIPGMGRTRTFHYGVGATKITVTVSVDTEHHLIPENQQGGQ